MAAYLPPTDRGPRRCPPPAWAACVRLAFMRAGQTVGLILADLEEVLRIRDQGKAPCRHVTDLVETRIREVDERI